jgi:hypothetical protein
MGYVAVGSKAIKNVSHAPMAVLMLVVAGVSVGNMMVIGVEF